MYGVIKVAGHQYRVQVGDLIDVQKLAKEENSMIELDEVLFIGGDKTIVGLPTVAGAKVEAKLIKHARSRKVTVLKRKPGLMRKKNGHRQEYSALLITKIEDGQGNVAEIDKSSKTATKYLA